MQSASYECPQLIVRSEVANSVIRMLDGEAKGFSHGKEPGERALSATFAGLAESVRAGRSIYFELSFEPYGAPMSREITNAIGHYINSQVSEDGAEAEAGWSYVSDLAALAADIEAACKQVEADKQVKADATAIGVSVNELLSASYTRELWMRVTRKATILACRIRSLSTRGYAHA